MCFLPSNLCAHMGLQDDEETLAQQEEEEAKELGSAGKGHAVKQVGHDWVYFPSSMYLVCWLAGLCCSTCLIPSLLDQHATHSSTCAWL